MADINRIMALQKVLNDLMPFKPEDQKRLDKKFRMEFNFNSNHLEGNTLTYGETELLLLFGDAKGNHSKRELDEMESHDVAFQLIKDWAKTEHLLSEKDIKELNEIILVKPFWKDAVTADNQPTRRLIKIGQYKEYPNSVRLENGEIFDYASPQDTPILMGELIEWYRTEEEKKELHPVELAALLHYRFVRIHPFDDGNGRISRLLMNYVLFNHNLPPVVIKSSDKKNYLYALHLADIGNLSAFVDYIGEQLLWSLDISIKAAKGESIDEPGDFEKRVKILQQKYINTEEFKVEKSRDSVIGCYEKSIIPFLNSVNDKINKLSVFFEDREQHMVVIVGNTATSAINPQYAKNIIEQHNWAIDEIQCFYDFNGLRKGLKETGKVFSLRLDFYFHKKLYELQCTNINITIDKRYNEVFTTEEINSISEKLGDSILDKIDTELSK